LKQTTHNKVAEFVGLPGSGKSTLVVALTEDFLSCETVESLNLKWRKASALQKLWCVISSMIAVQRLYLLLRLMVKARITKRPLIRRVIHIHLYERWIEMNKQDGIIMLDQGPVQNFWSIAVRCDAVKAEDHKALLCLLARGKSLVFVEAGLDVCKARILGRKSDSIYDGVDAGELNLSKGYKALEEIKALLQGEVIDNSAELANARDAAFKFLKQEMSGGSKT